MIELAPHASGESELTPAKATRFEMAVILLLSAAMIVLPCLEMILRRVRGSGIPGGFVYVQHATLWLGFLGALIATASNKHLGLATTSFLPEGAARNFAVIYGHVLSAAVTLIFAYASAQTVWANHEGDSMLAGGIPEWWSQCIVPVSLLLVSLRFMWGTPPMFGKVWLGRLLALLATLATAAACYAFRESGHSLLWPGVILVGVGFLLGAPVFVAMSGIAMLLFAGEGSPIASVPTETLRLVQNPTLPAIPLLTLAGFVMASGGASARLVRAYKGLFGWLPGGVSLMVISVCALFTTFTGGSGVTILALGGLVYPALVKDKYPEGFSLGLVTASGSLGLLFPPSLPVILYGAVASVGAEKLYLGGLVPGILLIVMVAAWSIRTGVKAKAPRQKFERGEMLRAMWAAKWDIGLPLVVVAVFSSGFATIAEAAALGAAYAVVIELFVFRDVGREMPKVMVQSATLVGAVVILLGVALGLFSYLVDAQIPDALVDWVKSHFHSQWTFLLALNGLLLVIGSIFEIYASIIVLAPLVAPLGALFNIDPVHLGVVFLANLELGFLFPPMGLNLLLSSARFNKPLPYLYRQSLPFLLIMAIGVLLITYVPAMTTGVVHLLQK